MKTGIGLLAVVVGAALCPSVANAQERRVPHAFEAADHIGEEATVCGQVASARFVPTGQGSPTFVNLERGYPDQPFTAVIPGELRDEFSTPPEEMFAPMRRVCVSGTIDEFNRRARIIIAAAGDIERVDDDR